MMTGNSPVSFKTENTLKNSLARAGVIATPHGFIHTPCFIPVGTKATLKSVKPSDFLALGIEVLLANTYHLFLQPGTDVIKNADGIQKFANWSLPTMTDSGGFQIFSLGDAFGEGVSKFVSDTDTAVKHNLKQLNVYQKDLASQHGRLCVIDDDGVTFTSHLDGSLHRFTAERSIEIQHTIGADIIVAFDECTSPTADYKYQKEALTRTHLWAKRSLNTHKLNYHALKKQGLYAVVQGGRFNDLRKESAQVLSDMDFSGYGIGGSFSKADLGDSLKTVNEILPTNKPRHLFGIGEPEDIVAGVLMGCDTFDCVAPARLARNGTVYIHSGNMLNTACGKLRYPELIKINLRKHQYINDHNILDPLSDEKGEVYKYTRAYLAHLFRANEMLGPQLATLHNIKTIIDFTKNLRQQILN